MLTGTTLLYWACVVACVVAGVFLMLARVRMGRAATPAGSRPSGPARHQQPPATTGGGTAVGATAVSADPTAEPARDADRAPTESGEVRSVTAPSDAPVGER